MQLMQSQLLKKEERTRKKGVLTPKFNKISYFSKISPIFGKTGHFDSIFMPKVRECGGFAVALALNRDSRPRYSNIAHQEFVQRCAA